MLTLPTYQTKQLFASYPFSGYTPAGDIYIQDIKLAVKDSAVSVFLTRAASVQSGIYYTFAADIQKEGQIYTVELGTFTYKDSLWMNLDNDFVFGFVKLKSAPEDHFTVTGKFQLHPHTFTSKVDNGGMKTLNVDGAKYSVGNQLKLSVQGNLQVLPEKDKLRVLRSSDNLYNYTNSRGLLKLGIYTINGYSVDALNITTSDSGISIRHPGQVSASMYYLFVNSSDSLITCSDPQA